MYDCTSGCDNKNRIELAETTPYEWWVIDSFAMCGMRMWFRGANCSGSRQPLGIRLLRILNRTKRNLITPGGWTNRDIGVYSKCWGKGKFSVIARKLWYSFLWRLLVTFYATIEEVSVLLLIVLCHDYSLYPAQYGFASVIEFRPLFYNLLTDSVMAAALLHTLIARTRGPQPSR